MKHVEDSQGMFSPHKMTNPFIPVHAEEPGVMPLLDYYKGDAWLIIFLQLDAGLTDC